jgi:hypothetical protein
LGIPAQASGKNLTRPPMPSAPQFVLVTSSRPNIDFSAYAGSDNEKSYIITFKKPEQGVLPFIQSPIKKNNDEDFLTSSQMCFSMVSITKVTASPSSSFNSFNAPLMVALKTCQRRAA